MTLSDVKQPSDDNMWAVMINKLLIHICNCDSYLLLFIHTDAYPMTLIIDWGIRIKESLPLL